MIPMEQIEKAVVRGLRYCLNTGKPPPPNSAPEDWGAYEGARPCDVIRQNQDAPKPAWPYLSYTITSPMEGRGGTYMEDPETGVLFMPITQRWSFTTQSDREPEAMRLGMLARDFMEVAGHIWLSDHGVTVQSVGNLNNRDNLISIQYEYRQGFDAVLTFLNRVDATRIEQAGAIEMAPLHYEP